MISVPGKAPGFYPAAVMLGGRDVMGQQVELSSAASTIQIIYKRNPGTVRGIVEGGAGSKVLLWPAGGPFPDIVPTATARADGAFEFSNVPPGDYSVIAFDRVPPDGAAPEFLASTIPRRGTRVSVQDSGVESVQIAVTRWGE